MASRDQLELGVLFDLLRAEQRLSDMLRAVLAPHGLTPSGYAVTSLLHALGRTTPTEVAAQVGTKPSTLTAHLSRLVADGFISRTAGADGRSVDLELTPSGAAAHAAAARDVRRTWRGAARSVGLDLGQAHEVLSAISLALDTARGSET